MPLMQSKSKQAFSKNVAAEREAGKPEAQSLAIAYSVQRQNKRKMAQGGEVAVSSPYQDREAPSSITEAIMKKKREAAERIIGISDNSQEALFGGSDDSQEALFGDDGISDPFDELNSDDSPTPEEQPSDMIGSIRQKLKAKRGF